MIVELLLFRLIIFIIGVFWGCGILNICCIIVGDIVYVWWVSVDFWCILIFLVVVILFKFLFVLIFVNKVCVFFLVSLEVFCVISVVLICFDMFLSGLVVVGLWLFIWIIIVCLLFILIIFEFIWFFNILGEKIVVIICGLFKGFGNELCVISFVFCILILVVFVVFVNVLEILKVIFFIWVCFL